MAASTSLPTLALRCLQHAGSSISLLNLRTLTAARLSPSSSSSFPQLSFQADLHPHLALLAAARTATAAGTPQPMQRYAGMHPPPPPALQALGGFLLTPRMADAVSASSSSLWLGQLPQQERSTTIRDTSLLHALFRDAIKPPGMDLPSACPDISIGTPHCPPASRPEQHLPVLEGDGTAGTLLPLDAPPAHAPPATPLECAKRGMTYQPSHKKRVNSHGLEKRLSTPGGRLTLMRRIQRKRSKLTADCFV